jgi:hypothetical protein
MSQAALLGQLRVEEHLEPEVPQLFAQVTFRLPVAGHQRRQRVQHLGCFFSQVPF